MKLSGKWKSAQKSIGCLMVVGALAAPSPAFAFQSLMSIAMSKMEKILQDIEETAALNSAIIESTISQLMAKQSSVEAMLASASKMIAGRKELTQSKLNYQAAQLANNRLFDAQNRFTDVSSRAPGLCEVGAASEQARAINIDASLNEKALTRSGVRQQLYVENATVVAKDIYETYKSRYCSNADVQRGRCTTAVDPMMQGASLEAGTLLTPTSGETYTAQESQAAADFIQMVTNPFPEEMLPKSLEKSQGANRFLLAQMHAQAQMSVAQGALNHVMASREALSQGDGPKMSVVALMKDIAGSRFGVSKHESAVAGTGENAMYQLINLNLADSNWMDYQAYRQNEKIESVLASQLAVAAKLRSDVQVGVARSFISR